eukprot:COSAG04_NODE_675_length_11271_cov_4.894289_4_plen_212_part_00
MPVQDVSTNERRCIRTRQCSECAFAQVVPLAEAAALAHAVKSSGTCYSPNTTPNASESRVVSRVSVGVAGRRGPKSHGGRMRTVWSPSRIAGVPLLRVTTRGVRGRWGMKRPRQHGAWPFAAPSWPSSSPSPGRPVAGRLGSPAAISSGVVAMVLVSYTHPVRVLKTCLWSLGQCPALAKKEQISACASIRECVADAFAFAFAFASIRVRV